MSRVSNGHPLSSATGESGADAIRPIPETAALHFVALLGSGEEAVARFLRALPARGEPLGPMHVGSWTAVERPRPSTFTDLQLGDWQVRLVFDPEGLPPSLHSTIFPDEPSSEVKEVLERHRACCLVFLTKIPGDPSMKGWSRFLHFAQLAWAWLDAGAELLCFPEARAYLPRRLLLGLEPEQLTPEHAYLFVTNGVAHRESRGRVWIRTWGMGQFGLPDLAAPIIMEGPPEELEILMESLRLLLETLPAAMIRDHGILPPHGTVQVGSIVWRAVGAPDPAPPQTYLSSRFGIQTFERAPS